MKTIRRYLPAFALCCASFVAVPTVAEAQTSCIPSREVCREVTGQEPGALRPGNTTNICATGTALASDSVCRSTYHFIPTVAVVSGDCGGVLGAARCRLQQPSMRIPTTTTRTSSPSLGGTNLHLGRRMLQAEAEIGRLYGLVRDNTAAIVNARNDITANRESIDNFTRIVMALLTSQNDAQLADAVAEAERTGSVTPINDLLVVRAGRYGDFIRDFLEGRTTLQQTVERLEREMSRVRIPVQAFGHGMFLGGFAAGGGGLRAGVDVPINALGDWRLELTLGGAAGGQADSPHAQWWVVADATVVRMIDDSPVGVGFGASWILGGTVRVNDPNHATGALIHGAVVHGTLAVRSGMFTADLDLGLIAGSATSDEPSQATATNPNPTVENNGVGGYGRLALGARFR